MTTNAELDSVLSQTGPILLDFDGPVTHLFSDGRNRMVADRMREAMPAGVRLPDEVVDTHDPLVILRWAGQHFEQSDLSRIEGACVEGELLAAAASAPTPGAAELLRTCVRVGRSVVVVSNNAKRSISAFLEAHALDKLVLDVVARVPGRPDLMKPNPTSVITALRFLGADARDCAMIGDSVTDIQVCRTTGLRSIGFAKNRRRGQELFDAGADAIVDDLLTVADRVQLLALGPSR